MKDEIKDALSKLTKFYTTKKELVKDLNRALNVNFTYNKWKKDWAKDPELKSLLESKLFTQPSLYENIIYKEFPDIQGVKVQDQFPDTDKVIVEMVNYFEGVKDREHKKSNQVISFNEGPICLVNIADVHFGGVVDLKKLLSETECIVETPGMYLNFVGDLSNNFISPWTTSINHFTKFTIEEEHAIDKHWLNLAKRKMINCVIGNHDKWSIKESGIDLIKYLLNEIGTDTLYDTDENTFTLDVSGYRLITKTRHKWRGSSELNPTYGIEKAAQTEDFDIGVGGHIHVSGLYREFNNRGKTRYAVLCGAYPIYDYYAKEIGFPTPNKSSAICLIIDPNSECGVYGVSSIYDAAKIIKLLRK